MRLFRIVVPLILTLAAGIAFAGNLVPALPAIKPSVVAVGTEVPTRTPPINLLGSGFAVANGLYIITNAHVIPGVLDHDKQERVGVMMIQGPLKRFRYAKIVRIDQTHDIALLKLEGDPIPALELADSDTLQEGQSVAFTGFPIGMALQQLVTHRGMVSSVGPVVLPALRGQQLDVKMVKRLRDPFNIIQLDATAYPGNSGSALYDPESGKVYGIIDAVYVKSTKESAITQPSGITYAIPSNFIRALLRDSGMME
jgi:serine protease Do